MSIFGLAFGLATIVVACANASKPDTGVELTEPTEDAAADPGAFGSTSDAGSDASTPEGTDCKRDLTIGALSVSNAQCTINEHVSNRKTTLLFPCAGGAATADFDGHSFTGTVSKDGKLVLTDEEAFTFRDCEWIGTERIEGDLSSGELTYTYSEKPKTTCPDLPCTASGSLSVAAGDVVVVR